jgi:hypothetical protein
MKFNGGIFVSEEPIPICERCGNPINDCTCRCPYCGEIGLCECCIGRQTVTGG